MLTRGVIGLAAVSVMPLLGPRPLFVRTAYADAPAIEHVTTESTEIVATELMAESFDSPASDAQPGVVFAAD